MLGLGRSKGIGPLVPIPYAVAPLARPLARRLAVVPLHPLLFVKITAGVASGVPAPAARTPASCSSSPAAVSLQLLVVVLAVVFVAAVPPVVFATPRLLRLPPLR
eukprot:TRINITY_DN8981_c0_g1_i1.p3 TRINITY_DN8981_c0_g1~~TRINITY_DN8981_c0_g1_i1.p3  ORF type:complete len:105 (-),score=0.64 TRINITY_DN8981_c0_g1_i1:88-402(-)